LKDRIEIGGKMKSSWLVVVLTLISLGTRLQASELEKQIIESMTSDFSKNIKTLSRDVYVYHWHKQELAAGIRLSNLKSAFYKYYDDDKNVVGKGLYAAVDPAQTDSYGHIMDEIMLPQGSRFLDYRKAGLGRKKWFPVSATTYELIKQLDPSLLEAAGGAKFFNKIKMTELYPDIFEKVFKKNLQLDFVVYPFETTKISYCKGGPSNQYTTAFVIFGKGKETTRLNSDDKINENKYHRILNLYYNLNAGAKSKLQWTEKNAIADAEVKTWAQTHLFGCSNSYPEDKPLNFVF
jgi:hypothetical protein